MFGWNVKKNSQVLLSTCLIYSYSGIPFLRLEDEDIQLFAVVERQIWLRQNSFIFGGDLIPPSRVVILAKDQLQAFLAAEQTRIGGSIRPPQPNSCISWTPSLDVIKFNWDAAISKREQRMGMGFLARNSAGHVLASYCATKPYIVDPGIAEAVSAWKMIEVAVSLGFQSVIFEGDSLEIVQALRNEGSCLGRFGQVVNEAKICLNSIHSWSIYRVKRSANNAAHCLAKYAFSLDSDQLWIDEYPSCIHDLVLFEKHLV
jgi:hypothetical protein